MKTRKFFALILVGILYIPNVNLWIVEGTKKLSLDNDLAIEWAGLENEMDLDFDKNYELANGVEYDDEDVEYEFDRNSDEDGSFELDDAIDEDDDTEFKIDFNSLRDEGNRMNDEDEEDEYVDPCISEPDLAECNEDQNEDDEEDAMIYPSSRKIDVSGGIFFNNAEKSNDLEGDLRGNVVFAQASTFPSRPAKNSDDIRPHLVALRETLVLFKPLSETFDPASGTKMSVLDQDDNIVYEKQMSPPEQLPAIADRIGDVGDEFLFLEPDTYDITVHGIVEFNDDVDLLMSHKTIKVDVSDDGWVENVHLSTIVKEPIDTLTMITFSSTSTRPFYVNYGGSKLKIKPDGKMIFTNLNGKWENIYESAYLNDDAIKNLIINNKESMRVISEKESVTNLGKDTDGSGIATFLRDFGNIHIVKGYWNGSPKTVYLPQNAIEFDKKIVVFTSTTKKASNIYYGDSKVILNKEDTLIFLSINGKWLEWSDALFGAIQYGENFWSARIPKEHVKPRMSLAFQNGEAIGSIPEVVVGAPTELVLHTIDIGMLVEPRGVLNFADNTECQESYFQTIPVSRLIITQYEPVHFTEIVLSDNTTYTTHSMDEGSVYKGDMREDIGKSLISTGINMANYGIHSTFGPSSAAHASPYYRSANWYTIHNSRGNYINGVQVHGMSGGGTVVTLFRTCHPNKNEHGHEIGHNWAGHYPNGFFGSVHRPSDYFGSSWGWNSDFNLFLPNFYKKVSGDPQCLCKKNKETGAKTDCTCQESFFGHKFGKDAMADGTGAMYPSISYFTMHTPFMMYRIQNGNGTGNNGKGRGLEKFANWDRNSETGMVKWDLDCKCMKPWSETPVKRGKGKKALTDSRNFEDLPRKPVEQGVAVATLVGFYDPELTMRTYIYPAMHGSYGNVFASNTDDEINDLSENACYASVTNEEGDEKNFILKDVRQAGKNKAGETGKNMNKFHINIAETFEPTSIKIYCRGQKITERSIEKPTRTLTYNVMGNQF